MNYSLHIQKEAEEQCGTLVLSGFLTIHNCLAIQAELLAYAKQLSGIQLLVKEVEELDVTCLQLFVALGKFQEQQQKAFSLTLDLNTNCKQLVQFASFHNNHYLNIL